MPTENISVVGEKSPGAKYVDYESFVMGERFRAG